MSSLFFVESFIYATALPLLVAKALFSI